MTESEIKLAEELTAVKRELRALRDEVAQLAELVKAQRPVTQAVGRKL